MTVVENLNPRIQYTYTNETQEYPITFPYIERQYVKCMVGDTLLTYNIDYQVPAFDQESLDEDELYLTLLITPTVGDVITIYRATPLDQQAEFPQEAKFSSQKITEALDKLTHQQQEQQDDLDTCLRLSKNIPVGFNTELPSPAANQVIQWNEDGTQLINYDLREEIETIDAKADEAIDTAEEADTTANQALSIANSASTTANSAMNTANDADTKSDTAVATANQAASEASDAVSTATSASQIANTASQVATAASEKVDDLEEDIEAVIEAAEKINELEEAVDTAVTAANTATTAATNASIAATNASTAADTATQKAQEVSQALNNIATINETSLLNGGNINLQVPLISGTNIKTINNNSILGSGDLTLDGLPSQTGQSGKFLTTNGTNASWAAVQAGANQDINNLTTLGNARLQYAPFAINAGTVLNSENNTLHTNNEVQYKKYNFTEVGTLTKDKSIISGFSSANYATITPKFIPQSGDTWEVVREFTTGNDISGTQMIYISGADYQAAGYYGMSIYLYGGNIIASIRTTNGRTGITVCSVSSSTKYRVKVTFDGSIYSTFYSNGDDNYTTGGTYTNSYPLNYSASYSTNCLGYDGIYGASPLSGGSINLANCYNKINNNIVWQGIIDGTISDYDYSEGVGTQVICDPCTITTTDGRTKIFDTASTIDVSSDMEYKKYNFTEVGTLTKNKNIVSSFSASNYIKLLNSFAPESNTWKIQLKVKTGNSVSTLQNIFSKGFGTYYGIRIDVDTTGHFYYLVSSSSGGSSTIMENAGATAITTNTDYWLKFSFDGSKYLAQISTDGVNWQEDYTKNSTNTLYNFTADTTLGYGLARQAIFTGEIDVAQCYIKINNQITWQGVIDGTSSDYDYTIGATYEGSYSIFKNYETGKLSLGDELVIGKTNIVPFVQPVLSANGTMGGDSFAVEASSEALSSHAAWKAFDNVINTNDSDWQAAVAGANSWITFYNPSPLKVTNLNIRNRYSAQSSGYYTSLEGIVYGSNDNSTWTVITTYTNSVTGYNATWNIDLSLNTNFYKYYKILNTRMNSDVWIIQEMVITATTPSNNSWLDTSTIPANLRMNGVINNDLVYIGDCTVLNGEVTALTNRYFNACPYYRDLVDSYRNGESWYVVYSDGWCEQGGEISLSGAAWQTISFLKHFKDTNYQVLHSIGYNSIASLEPIVYDNKTTISVQIASNNTASRKFSWQAKGYIA